jgi:CRISPR-associated protein Cas4
MKISVTMLSTYLYCPRLLFLQKVLQVEEVEKEALVLGSIRHESFDKINKNEESLVASIKKNIDFNYLNQIYKQHYSRFLREIIIKNKKRLREVDIKLTDAFKRNWNNLREESESRALNIFNFIEKHNIYGKELWNKLTPKIQSEIRVESEDLQLKGIIDQVHVYGEEYVPIELKTGKSPKDGMWPGHRIQIGAYALLLEEKFKTKVKEGFVHYLDSKQKRHLAINPFLKEEIKDLVKEVQELINIKRLPNYCENENKCKACSLNTTCYSEEELNKYLKEAEIEV